jgi:hypothetical protein
VLRAGGGVFAPAQAISMDALDRVRQPCSDDAKQRRGQRLRPFPMSPALLANYTCAEHGLNWSVAVPWRDLPGSCELCGRWVVRCMGGIKRLNAA